MTSVHHTELEEAKRLQKLLQGSTDEPDKLARKLYLICEHMKLSGKKHSLSYQVLSRANEEIVKQHGLDMNAPSLWSSHLPLSCWPQEVDTGHEATSGKETIDIQLPANQNDLHYGGIPAGTCHGASSSKTKEEANTGPFQNCEMLQASEVGPGRVDMTRNEMIFPSKPLVGLSRVGNMPVDTHRGSFSHRSDKSSVQGSPACVPMNDTRSVNSRETHDSRKSDNKTKKKNTKKVGNKRKRADFCQVGNQYTTSKFQNENYLGSCSGSQLLKNRADANSINVSTVFPDSAKSSSDRILHNTQKNSEGPTSSSLHAYAASARFAAFGKAVLQEKKEGQQIRATSYTNPSISGVQERQCLDNVSSERKLKSLSNLDAKSSTNTSFNDQQLRQLRAQWLLFLAFRNNLVPRKLHLEIALDGNYAREGGGVDGAQRVLNDYRGTDTSARDSVDNHERSGMFVCTNDTTKASTACSSGGSMGRDSSLKVKEIVKKKNTENLHMSMVSEVKGMEIVKKTSTKNLHMSMASEVAFENTTYRREVVDNLLVAGPMAALNLFANQLIDGLTGIEVVQQLLKFIGITTKEQADEVEKQETSVKSALRIIELEAELAAARQEVVELKHSLKMGAFKP